MSKRLKNFPDPSIILKQHGADALRLFLINSPVVRAESVRFQESGVKEVVSRVLLPLWNSYRFFSEQAILYKKTTGHDFIGQLGVVQSSNIMDKWILANCQSLLRFINQEMLGKDTSHLSVMQPNLTLERLPALYCYSKVAEVH